MKLAETGVGTFPRKGEGVGAVVARMPTEGWDRFGWLGVLGGAGSRNIAELVSGILVGRAG